MPEDQRDGGVDGGFDGFPDSGPDAADEDQDGGDGGIAEDADAADPGYEPDIGVPTGCNCATERPKSTSSILMRVR